MSTLADSLVSSTSRPIALRMRPDLSARRHQYHGQSYWVVKEPIGLNYYRFHDEEYAILCMLDGYSSMESIKERFESEFVPQKINYSDLQQFIGMLHRSTLVISQASGQGYQLKSRRDQKRRREMLGRLSNVFAVRWRGIDPERILNRVSVFANWFFSWITVACVCLFALSALTLVAVQFDKFVARLPTFHQFFGPQGIPIPYSDKTGGSTGIVLGVLGDSTAILLCILGMVRDVHYFYSRLHVPVVASPDGHDWPDKRVCPCGRNHPLGAHADGFLPQSHCLHAGSSGIQGT